MRHLGDQTRWIVLGPHGTGECLRCGQMVRISLPVHTEVWRATMKAFVRVHKRCREPREVRVTIRDFRDVGPYERKVV